MNGITKRLHSLNQVCHIFTASRLHLVPQIIQSFYNKIDNVKHIFILVNSSNDDVAIYELIRKQNPLISIYFVNTPNDLPVIIRSKQSAILVHSVIINYITYLLFNRYTNVNVVLWGTGVSVNTIRQKFLYPFKICLYKSLKSIVVLMSPEKELLISNFYCNNVFVLPYIGERELIIRRVKPLKVLNPIICLGNNSSCIGSYIYILNSIIYRFRNDIQVDVMLNYNLSQSHSYHRLLNILMQYPNGRVNTNYYNLTDYIDYMNSFSIYICGREDQSGLGAIYTCLYLGKKIFLAGANYDWIKSLGCNICHINDISFMSYDELVAPLSDDIIVRNRLIIEKFENTEQKISRWKEYLNNISE